MVGSDTEGNAGQFPWLDPWCLHGDQQHRHNVLFLPNYLCSQACLENVVCLERLQAPDRWWLLKAFSGQLSFA